MTFNSILEAVFHHADTQPDKLAVVSGGQELTYGAYRSLVVRMAKALQKAGLAPGGGLVVVTEQTVAYLASELAVQLAGGVFVPLEKGVGPERLAEIAGVTGAALVLAKTESLPGARCMTMAALVQLAGEEDDTNPFPLPQADAVSEILFTTGTTGVSKGVVMRYSASVAVAQNVQNGVEMRQGNVELIPVPLNHSYGLRRYYANMLGGNTVVLLDGVVFVKRVYALMEQYHVTAMALVPAAAAVLLKLDANGLGQFADQLDYVQIGSANLPEADKKALCALLPKVRLYNFYGSSEAGCSCIINYNSPQDKPSCIGRPTVNSRFKFVDEDRREVEASAEAPALLATAGGMVMEGYYNAPQLTAETLQDGYVYSNDLAYRGEDGNIYLVGRRDDVINVGGNKVAPNEIESKALLMEGVRECACVGMADAVAGQVPKLFVVMEDGAAFDPQAINTFLTQHLEYYKLPKQIVQLDALPRTYNGKLDRKQLV